MTAERKPLGGASYLARPLAWTIRLAARCPSFTLAAALLLAVVAVGYAAAHLSMRTSRLDLLNPKSPYNQRWIRFIHEFGDKDDVVVVVEGSDRRQVVAALEHVGGGLAQQPQRYEKLLWRVDLRRLRAKGLYYVPLPQLRGIERLLASVDPILEGDWSQLRLGGLIAQWAAVGERAEEAGLPEAAGAQLAGWLGALRGDAPFLSPWSAIPNIPSPGDALPQYLLTGNGKFGFVLLRLATEDPSLDAQRQTIEQLRGLLRRMASQHPHVSLGLTGLPVMENDEMVASSTATMRAGVMSLVGVALLFVAGFGGLWHPLLTVVTLVVGIAWSVGFATLTVGHLNILSMAFGVILVGLGIDFSIHYLARYQELRVGSRSSRAALADTVASVGPGIVTGGLTTAVAFFCAGLTEFTGIAELGVIAGSGVILCLLAALWVLPALLEIRDRNRPPAGSLPPLDTAAWLGPLHQMPVLTVGLSLVATALLATGLARLKYDHNLLNLQPRGMESVELEQKLLAESDQSLWYALSVAERPDELLARKERFLEQPSVQRVEEIVSLFPAETAEKRPIIEHIAERLAALPQEPPQIPVDSPGALRAALAPWVARGDSSAGSTMLKQLSDQLGRLSDQECYRRLSDYQQAAASDLLSRLHALRGMARPEPPQWSDLADGLTARFVGRHGRHLMKIYGKGNIWDMDALRAFVADVRAVDPQATGKPLQTYEASRQMRQSYLQAAVYSLAAVTLLLWLDFRSIGLTLLALLPLGLGIVQMFGLFGLLEIPLNPANMIVLPLILGIGIDDGVHLVHDFHRQHGRYRLTSSTATAVLMTSLTSMVGFGSLMAASHRGLESLGRVLTIGICCCLFSSLVTLPALLAGLSRTRRWKRLAPESELEDEAEAAEDAGARAVPGDRQDALPLRRGKRRRAARAAFPSAEDMLA